MIKSIIVRIVSQFMNVLTFISYDYVVLLLNLLIHCIA